MEIFFICSSKAGIIVQLIYYSSSLTAAENVSYIYQAAAGKVEGELGGPEGEYILRNVLGTYLYYWFPY